MFFRPQAAGAASGRLPSRHALLHPAQLMVWARSRFALADRAERDPKD